MIIAHSNALMGYMNGCINCQTSFSWLGILLTLLQQRDQPNNRTYNFYLSQQRIRIEMAFGLLCTKWRIFHSNLDSKFGLEFQSKIVETACRLHNYVLDEEKANFSTQDCGTCNLEEWGVEALPNGPAGNNGYLRVPNEEENLFDEVLTQSSASRREAFVDNIIEMKLSRPQHNCDQNIEYDNNKINDYL